jgi:hypothetical protein
MQRLDVGCGLSSPARSLKAVLYVIESLAKDFGRV